MDPGTFFLEGFLEIGVHVTGNGFHGVHPFQADMFDKVIDHLLLLPMGEPKDMAGIKVYNVDGITVAVVELELSMASIFAGCSGLISFVPSMV